MDKNDPGSEYDSDKEEAELSLYTELYFGSNGQGGIEIDLLNKEPTIKNVEEKISKTKELEINTLNDCSKSEQDVQYKTPIIENEEELIKIDHKDTDKEDVNKTNFKDQIKIKNSPESEQASPNTVIVKEKEILEIDFESKLQPCKEINEVNHTNEDANLKTSFNDIHICHDKVENNSLSLLKADHIGLDLIKDASKKDECSRPISVGNYNDSFISDDEYYHIDQTKLSITATADVPPPDRTATKRRLSEDGDDVSDEEESRCGSTTCKKLISRRPGERVVECKSTSSSEDSDADLCVLPPPPTKTFEVVTVESDSSDCNLRNTINAKPFKQTSKPKNGDKSTDLRKEQNPTDSSSSSEDSSDVAIIPTGSVGLTMNISQEMNDLINPFDQDQSLTGDYYNSTTATHIPTMYDSDETEELDLYKTLASMSSAPGDWKICNNEYLKHRKRRYFENQQQRCKICRQYGHKTRECSRVPCCFLCSEIGHTKRYECPKNMCFKCCGPPHIFCRKTNYSIICSLCNSRGHLDVMCPDIWRRFHVTISGDGLEPTIPSNARLKNEKSAYCYNCAKKGHFGHNCFQKHLNKDYFIASPRINNYDIPLPMMTDSYAKKLPSANIGQSYEETTLKESNHIKMSAADDDSDVVVLPGLHKGLSSSTPTNSQYSLPKKVAFAISELQSIYNQGNKAINLDRFKSLTNLLQNKKNQMRNKQFNKVQLQRLTKKLQNLSFIVYCQKKLGNGATYMKKIKNYVNVLNSLQTRNIPAKLLNEMNLTIRVMKYPSIENLNTIVILAQQYLKNNHHYEILKKRRKQRKNSNNSHQVHVNERTMKNRLYFPNNR